MVTSALIAPVISALFRATLSSLIRIDNPAAFNAASDAFTVAVTAVPCKCNAPAASNSPGAEISTSTAPVVPCTSVRAVNFTCVSPPVTTRADPLKSRTAAYVAPLSSTISTAMPSMVTTTSRPAGRMLADFVPSDFAALADGDPEVSERMTLEMPNVPSAARRVLTDPDT